MRVRNINLKKGEKNCKNFPRWSFLLRNSLILIPDDILTNLFVAALNIVQKYQIQSYVSNCDSCGDAVAATVLVLLETGNFYLTNALNDRKELTWWKCKEQSCSKCQWHRRCEYFLQIADFLPSNNDYLLTIKWICAALTSTKM